MKRLRLLTRTIIPIALPLALVALSLMPLLATAAGSKAKEARYNKAVPHVAISLTGKGMVATPKSLTGGNYLLTIKNRTSEPRGVEMIGIDKASSPTVRYTKILQPGRSESFRWYFAKGKTVYVRDITSCGPDQRSCMAVTFGRMRKAIDVD